MDTLVRQRIAALPLADLWALTKPRQTLLLLVTGICAYTLSRGLPFSPLEGLWMSVGLFCSIGGCTALNMLMDRDIDAKMARTADRPLPRGSVRPNQALVLGGLLSAVGLGVSLALDRGFGLAVFSGFAIDLLVYTTWLKRRTPLSILFGGISGGMPILAGRVLAVGRVDLVGLILAGSVLLCIPSHILTLAIRHAADYEEAGIPAWPNAYGPKATRLFIAAANLLNTLLLTGAGLLLDIERWALVSLFAVSLGLFALSAWQIAAPSSRRNWVLFKAASLYMLASSLLLTLGAIL